MKIKISEVKQNFKEYTSYLMASSNSFASLMDFTKEEPSLTAILLALKSQGYELVLE